MKFSVIVVSVIFALSLAGTFAENEVQTLISQIDCAKLAQSYITTGTIFLALLATVLATRKFFQEKIIVLCSLYSDFLCIFLIFNYFFFFDR